MRTIQVTQTASEKREPDETMIEVRLQAESEKYAEATEGLRRAADAAAVCRERAGIKKKEVSARGASVQAVRKENKTVYVACDEHRITLKADDARIGALIDALDERELPWRQTYRLADTSYRKSLTEKAVAAARAAAETIAAAAGVRLGALASVEYVASQGGGIMLMRAARSDNAVAPEAIEVSESVTCAWKIDGGV